jgi:hypothetical protein
MALPIFIQDFIINSPLTALALFSFLFVGLSMLIWYGIVFLIKLPFRKIDSKKRQSKNIGPQEIPSLDSETSFHNSDSFSSVGHPNHNPQEQVIFEKHQKDLIKNRTTTGGAYIHPAPADSTTKKPKWVKKGGVLVLENE